ncbi:hypothetical protein D1007_43170 [Hordeum vulgare]|nr:hypothetical protein D1007_43170 [Hordeum vulgare]
MDAKRKNCGALRCQKDRRLFIDLSKDFIAKMVIPCRARHDFLEKFRVPLDATITFQCTLMKMLTGQQFNCLVTNEPTRTYFGFPGWTALATAYKMEARERAMLYFDYDRDEIMVYYRPAGSDSDGTLTPDYDLDSVPHNVELASY